MRTGSAGAITWPQDVASNTLEYGTVYLPWLMFGGGGWSCGPTRARRRVWTLIISEALVGLPVSPTADRPSVKRRASMPRNKDLTNLREVLTGFFRQRNNAWTVALDTGRLDIASIDWTNRPRSLWQSVLEDAESRGQVPNHQARAHNTPRTNPSSSQRRTNFTSQSGCRTSPIKIGRARPAARPWKS